MRIHDVYQKAIDFAAKAHSKQQVPGKEYCYIVHLANVAMEVLVALQQETVEQPELAIQCALLHDTLEDTSVTAEELAAIFDEEVYKGVQALTKNKEISKSKQIVNSLLLIKEQPREIGLVKMADRITNLQKPPASWTSEKIQAYAQEARIILAALKHCHRHLAQRLEEKIVEYKKKYSSI